MALGWGIFDTVTLHISSYVQHSYAVFPQLTCKIPVISMYLQADQKTVRILISFYNVLQCTTNLIIVAVYN